MNFKLIEKEFAIYITKNEMLKIKEKTKTNEYKLAIKLKKKYRVSDNAVYVFKVKQENKKICSFCEADLTQERPKKKQTLSQEEAYQTQPELSKYHTYDLLLLLSYLREQRSTAYKTMQSVRKAPNEVKTSRNDYDELNEYGQEFYREATARKNIIEQILIDRMGYYPKRVDNKLL